MGQPFASHPGGSDSCPGDAPTLTMEPGSPVSDASQQNREVLYTYICIYIHMYLHTVNAIGFNVKSVTMRCYTVNF